MTALTVEADRAHFGGIKRRLPVEISANPYAGSALSFAADGYVHELTSGEVFAGFCVETIQTKDAASADGSRHVEVQSGAFTSLLTISGVAIDDVQHRRKVYASDDNAFNMTGSGTLIGEVIGLDTSGKAIVLCQTPGYDTSDGGYASGGIETLADAPATLTTAQLDKLLVITPSAGRTLTLPVAADCTGRTFTVKTLAAQVVTLDGNAAETVDGAATSVLLDAANDVLTIMSTGSAWLSVCGKIA